MGVVSFMPIIDIIIYNQQITPIHLFFYTKINNYYFCSNNPHIVYVAQYYMYMYYKG